MNLPPGAELGECRVRRCTAIDPTQDCIVIERADQYVLVSEAVLANADERFMHVGDGILIIHGRDGDVSYGLSHYDEPRMQYLGTRCG